MSMRKISLGRYISLLLFFSLLLTPVRTWGVGWTPSDAGLIVNMEQGERFLLSVWVDKNGNGTEEPGEEFFVSNYNRYSGGYYDYAAGSFMKLLPATEVTEMNEWSVGAPLDRGNKALGGIVYTIWNDGKTLKTKEKFKFLGELTSSYTDGEACDVVFVIPTERGVPDVTRSPGPAPTSFDPNGTLGRGTIPFNGRMGTGFLGMTYREVYMFDIPKANGPQSYTNAALVTFNTTLGNKTWSAGTIAKGHAAYAFADKKHDPTTRTLFRLYLLDNPMNSCSSYFFATDEQDYTRYRKNEDRLPSSQIAADSTAFRKIYTMDRLMCMSPADEEHCIQTDYMRVPDSDSTYYYVGYNNKYKDDDGESMGTSGAKSRFTKIRELPIFGLPSTFKAPAGAIGRMVADTTSAVANLDVRFKPAGYFLKVQTGKNVRMHKTDKNEWTSEEMWTITGDWAKLHIKTMLMTGSTFSESDPGAAVEGWTKWVRGDSVPTSTGESVVGLSGYAQITTNSTDSNGHMVFILADQEKWIRYDNNGFTGLEMPLQYPLHGENEVVLMEPRIKPDYKFLGWDTKADGTGTRYQIGDPYTFSGTGEVKLYAQAEYEGTLQIAISFLRAGKRYFLTHPGTGTGEFRYARARHFDNWDNTWQGMEDAANLNPNYLSTYELRHPYNDIKRKEGDIPNMDTTEHVLDPRRYTMKGQIDSLTFYEHFAPSKDEFIGLYYQTPNTIVANNTWAGLFRTTSDATEISWPTYKTPYIASAKIHSERYLEEYDSENKPDSLILKRRSNYTESYVQYDPATNQFNGVASAEDATEFQMSAVIVADAHYIILPDSTHAWRDTLEFGYHKDEQTTKDVWSSLIGKQLLAVMVVDGDTVYFHPNSKKTINDPNELYLSPDYRVTQLFELIPDSRVTSVAETDRVTHEETSYYWHHNIVSGNSSPFNVKDAGGNYIDIIDTFRITLSQSAISKIKEYRGRWKKQSADDGLHVDGLSRYRDVIVRTKTYHYGAPQTRLELTPEFENYTFSPLKDHSQRINFVLTKVFSHELLDIHNNRVGEEIISIDTITTSLALSPELCTFSSSGSSSSTYFTTTEAVSQHVTLTTKAENVSGVNYDTMTVSTNITINAESYPVTARIPLMQTALEGHELIWSVYSGNQRYYITAGTGNNGLIFRQYKQDGSTLYKSGSGKIVLVKGSANEANNDGKYITPWQFSYPNQDTHPDQLTLRTEYGVGKNFVINGSTPEASGSAASVMTFKFINVYSNANANYEEQVKIRYGANQWLKFDLMGGSGAELILVASEEEASVFSWSYLLQEYSLLNNGTYPSRDTVTFGYNTNMSVGVQTRYKAYKEYSMLVGNKVVYCCRQEQARIDSLTAADKQWKTRYTITRIPDGRTFDSGSTPSPAVSGLSDVLNAETLTTTISTSGAATSPMNVKIDGKYVNIVDTLHVTISLQPGAPAYRFKDGWSSYQSVRDAELKIPLIRTTYHIDDFDSLACTVANDEYNYTFPNKVTLDPAVTHTFVLGTANYTGKQVLDVNNRPFATIDSRVEDVTNKMDLSDKSLAEVRLMDDYGNTPSWCKITGKTKNTITVQCTENGIRSPRRAYIFISYVIMLGGDMRFVSQRLSVSQPSLYEYANNQQLIHSSGASGDPLVGGIQQVHENKRVLYYYPEQNVELPVRESHFFGWWRWYREGEGEIGDSDIPDSVWRTKPQNTGTYNYPFRIIGDSVNDPDRPGKKKLVTMGRYTVFHYRANDYKDVRNNPPCKTVLVAPPITTYGVAEKDKPTVTYAVDISNYYDHLPMSLKYKNQIDTAYLDTMQAIPEPTLSLREVFELRPWTEMAARLEGFKSERTTNDAGSYALADEHYMEDHVVMAPLKNPLLLSTEQRYNYDNVAANKHSESLLGYYMRDDNWASWSDNRVRQDTMIWCGGWDAECKWYTYDPKTQKYTPCNYEITEGDDFLQVPAKQNIPTGKDFDTVYYCLRSRSQKTLVDTHGKDSTVDGAHMFNICRYMVIYHDQSKYGPKLESNGKALITNDEIEQRYEVLERLNFDYNKPGPEYTVYPHPLPWADASYGYTYPETPDLPHNRLHTQSDLPNFGEYGLVNRIHYTDYWYDLEQHGGASNGYMIYCDGMSSSGQVAALNLNTTLCAGQKMFFSGYIGNPSKNFDKKYARPNFTFSVQGSVNGTDWENITTYMTGDIEPKNGWYQIYFPIVFNTHVEYHHFRVRIYNMASSWDGNDFVIDDMCIFATKQPLIAYQANTACKEKEDVETPTHIILRLDYQGITGEGYNNESVYYTVKCVNKEGTPSFVQMIDHYLDEQKHLGSPDTICGRLYIPAREYEPLDPDSIFVNMNELIDTFDVSNGVFKEGYIYEILEGVIRPVKYVVHSAYLNPKDTFTVHMSAEYKDMLNSMCGLTSHLKVSNMMVLELNGEEVPDMEQTDLCANSTYDIGLHVKGSLYLDNSAPINLNGSCVNDWLLYGDTAEDKSVERYGYKYKDIVKVVKDILRCEPKGTTNANQFAKNLAAVNRNEMIRIQEQERVTLSDPSLDPYTMLTNLVNKGFLTLYQPTMTATVYSGDSIQYVIFPILGTGSDALHSASVEVCPLPILIKLKPNPESAKTPLIVGGLNRGASEMNHPVVVLANVNKANQEITLKVDSIMELVGIKTIELRSTDDPNFREGIHKLAYEPDTLYPTGEYYTKGSTITLRPSSSSNYKMKPGYSYTYGIMMQTILGLDTLVGGCEVGTIPFTVSVVPNYLRWDPQDTESDEWNKPGNWIGIDENNNPIHVNARFAPLNTTAILIPAMTDGRQYPELPDLSNKASYDSVKQVGFEYNTCDYIRFLPGAAMGQQQRMEYNHAIVDMPLPQNEWAFRSAPVKGMISGDLYMSNADLYKETSLWEVGSFDANGRNNTTGNASFWLSLYSKNTEHVGNTSEGIPSESRTTDGSWSKVANGLTLSLPPAQGWAVYSRTASGSPAAVRLPKEDDIYYYYNKSGERQDGQYEQNLQALRETNAEAQGGHAGELAFHPDGVVQSYLLSKDASSQKFVFGNPTMGYIDIWGFIADNGLVNEFGYMATNNEYTTVSKASALKTENVITEQKRYLPPMHAILVTTTAAASTSLEVRVNTSRVVVSPVADPSSAPRRTPRKYPEGIMTVTATNTVSPRCLSRLLIGQGYHDAVYEGEDALLMTLNIEKYTNNSTPATPFNLYAAEGENGLCIDLRDSIVNIPLSFYMSNLPFDPVTRLWFTGVNKIDEDLVLYDAVTESEQTIADGIYIDIQTPEQSHEVRYYIRRRGFTPQSGTDEPIVTGFEWIETEGEKAVKFIKDDHVYILVNGQVYTILGQKIK